MSAAHVVLAACVFGCGAPAEDPRTAEQRRGHELAWLLRERVCASVIAAYRNGARPTAVEVQLPGLHAADPPSRLLLVAPQLPSAEGCLGLESPVWTPAASTSGARSSTTAAPSASARPAPLDTRF